MNRRDLIQRVLVGSTVLLVVPSVLQSCSKDSSMDPVPGPGTGGGPLTIDLTLSDYSSLNTSGNYKVVNGIIIINVGGVFKALSSVCTHEGCTVGFDSASGNLKCPCHGSQFTTAGSVVNGPATSSLRTYTIALDNNILTIAV